MLRSLKTSCRNACAMGAMSAIAAFPIAAPAEAPDYASEIRPLLERSCYGCHGPERQKSGYRLDVRSIALKGGDSGRPAIVAHDSANSPLIRYVSGADPETVMPPKNSDAPSLSEEEVALLAAWIDGGPGWPDELAGELAEEAPHWSLEPLVAPSIPLATENPIDGFIQQSLQEKKLAASPAAPRRTLIQRLYYDLIGLPPTPEEVDAFCDDPDPAAYEALVDRLLASPRYGERWARHWLDTIQYADSHGYEHDIGRDHAWPYRDYVIEAFNTDTPWARFIREQLATDYFYPDEPALTPALGYLGATPFDFSTYLTAGVTFDYLARDLLVNQTTAAFISTTASCARCHDHKFDPIPQTDYYALQAVFAGVLKGDLAYDATPEIKQIRERNMNLLAAAERGDAGPLLVPENDDAIAAWIGHRGNGTNWVPLELTTFLSAEGATLSRNEEGIILASGAPPDKDTYTISGTTTLPALGALRLEVFADDSLPMKGPGRQDNGNFHLSELVLQIFEPGAVEAITVAFQRATADFNQKDWGAEKAIDGNAGTAWGIHPEVGTNHVAVFELAEARPLKPGTQMAISLKQLHGDRHLMGAFRLSVSSEGGAPAMALSAEATRALETATAERSPEQRAAIALAILPHIAREALDALPEPALVYTAAATVDIPDGAAGPKMATIEKPKPVHRMVRGNFDQPAEVVPPGALSALTALPSRFALEDPDNEASRRAALADWIASPENVLTWRSIVNRVWQFHFGRGICDTPSDLGKMGGTPSHPELLDWLALWFRDEANGSLKALHRLIVTSDTYQQASQRRDDGAEIDGENRLLWRQNIHRLDADAYRDYAIALTGKLDLRLEGPGVQHFAQGPGPQLTPTLDYAAYDWNSDGAGRRSIYRYVWRGIADPFMEALDFPDLGLLSPTRTFSVSSLQALALYNNHFVLHHSEVLAKRLEEDYADPEQRVARATQLFWYRDPTEVERAAFRKFVEANGLPAFCRVLLNSNEFLFVD